MLARGGAASLLVTVRPTGPIRLILAFPAPPPDRLALHFNGPAGHWLIRGSAAGPHQAVFPLPRNDTSLGLVLMLLSGGTLQAGPAESGLPTLSLPESGAAGRDWFVCARHSVTGM